MKRRRFKNDRHAAKSGPTKHPQRAREDRRNDRAAARPRTWPGLDAEGLLELLGDHREPRSASQLVELLELPGEAGRECAQILRQMVTEGRVIEARPGRYVAAGADGEYRVVLEAGPDGSLCARFDADCLLPVHARHRLGARPGDQAIAMRNRDDQALLVRLLRRADQRLLGTLHFSRGEVRLLPDNRREEALPVIGGDHRIFARYEAGDRVIGRVVTDQHGETVVRIEGLLDAESPEIADFELVCLRHDLPGAFAPELLEEAEAIAPDWALGARRDCRDDVVFTIDPASAKDFDDAICLNRRADGGWSVAVHIADVAHFVHQASAIDEEALCRGTSIYLVNRVIPMLPEVLSNGWCSLVPETERYAFSVFIELDAGLQLTSVEPAECLIRSRCRLTYEQAQTILSGGTEDGVPEAVASSVRLGHELAQDLRRQRERAGALNLFSVEHDFSLDVEGAPIEVSTATSDESHQLIEELMLLANRCIARWIDEQDSPCVHRVHGEPDPDRLAQFERMLHGYGLESEPLVDRRALRAVLARIDQEPPSARLVLNYLCLRCFQKALYQVENIGHYALAFKHYAHFTSPIRRYPDLLVHRLAKRLLGLPGYADADADPVHLEALARQSSFLERRAEEAERELRKIKAARYLDGRLGEVFSAVITLPAPQGLTVQLLETGLDGFVPVRELGSDWFEFDPNEMALVGRATGQRFRIGRLCDVQVVAVDIPRGQVTLQLVTLGAEMGREPTADAPSE